MWLPNIFIPVLIVGVLGSGVVGDYVRDQIGSICQRLVLESTVDPLQLAALGCVPQEPGVTPIEKFFKEKCEENGSPSSYADAKDSVKFFGNCIQFVIDAGQVETELRNVRLQSDLRNVYKKYCHRVPILRECVKYTTNSIGFCLKESEERKTAEIVYNIASTLLEFICYDDGDRFATFEEPGTIECLASKGEALTNCTEETFDSYIPVNEWDIETGPSRQGRLATPLIPSTEDCVKLDNFRNCTVGLLAECRNQGPAKLLDSAFNIIMEKIPCKGLSGLENYRLPIGNFTSDNETEVDNSTIPSEYTVNRYQNVEITYKEKCEQNGGPRAYKNAKKVPQHLEDCFTSLVNTTQLQAEIADAAPTGNLDVVFAKYCRRVPNLKKCVRQATKFLKPCLDPELRPQVDVINNVTRAFLRFSCYGDGDRLASFLTSGGPQCMESQAQALKDCAIPIFSSYDPPPGHDEFERFEAIITVDGQDCTRVREYQRCTVRALENCRDSSTANIVGSLIDSLIKVTPCKNVR